MLNRCPAGRAAALGRPLALRLCRPSTVRCLANSAPASETNAPVEVTVVGGGAAGLTAAFFAAEYGAKVTVLERTREAGKKILMSGGSRCNVLPLEVDLQQDFFSESSFSAMKAIFASWNVDLCKAWLEDPYWGVGLDLALEEETKKWFPVSNSSKEVRDKLVEACRARGVTFRYNASLEGLRPLVVEQQPLPQQQQHNHEHQEALPEAEQQQQGQQQEQLQTPLQAAAEAGQGEAGAGAGGEAGARQRRKGKGRGKGRGRRESSGSDSEAEEEERRRRAVRWVCQLQDGTEHVTDKVIMATGGLSFPAVGTDGTGLRLLRALGHSLHEPYPALTPLTGKHPAAEQLAGVSMYGIELSVQLPSVKKPRVSERTAMLFTHKGYSGPAVLDLSHYAVMAMTRGSVPAPRGSAAAQRPTGQAGTQKAVPPPEGQGAEKTGAAVSATVPGAAAAATAAAEAPAAAAAGAAAAPGAGQGSAGAPQGVGPAAATGHAALGMPSLRVNWTHTSPQEWDERLRAGGTAQVTTLLQRHGLRERLADALAAELGLGGVRVCDLKRGQRAALVSALTSYELPYHGHEGYKKAEVTGGGVRLEDLDCSTMESRLHPNLYICGECCDVFGRIGGFNFYFAWVSGRLAGIGAAQGGLHPERRAKKAAGKGASKGAAAAAAAPA